MRRFSQPVRSFFFHLTYSPSKTIALRPLLINTLKKKKNDFKFSSLLQKL